MSGEAVKSLGSADFSGGTEAGSGKSESVLKKTGIPLAIAVFALLLLMPTPAGLSYSGQKALAIFCAALMLWVAGSIPIYLTSMLAIIALTLTGTVKERVAFETLGFDVIWLMVSAFMLTAAMVKSNLARRFALWMITSFGGTPKRTLLVLIFINFALAFFVPSTTARASLMVPICVILLEIYRAVPGQSNFGRLMMLLGVQADAVATSGVMTGTAANMIAVKFTWTGRAKDELIASQPDDYAAWRAGRLTPAGSESWQQFTARIRDALADWIGRGGGDLLAIVHSGVVRAACNVLLGLAPHQILPVTPGTLTIFDFADGNAAAPRLEAYNLGAFTPDLDVAD